ncbi:MAG TPA: TraR/DksA C4-type zinc finger protein [Mycobacteriales bacterium]|nr:TraR/DksA C4-type zinc finger protein [Mycobacteriales bacterium]
MEAEELRALRAAAADEIAALTAARDALIASSEALDDEHDPEGATIAFEREQLAALRAAAEQRVADLDAALDRLAAGTYGVCEVCGRPIAAARLEALPAARRCITCAAR